MATINVYGTISRVRVQYAHDRNGVNIGVEHESVDGAPEVPPSWNEDGGMWSDLDRDGCNTLIRGLREARDKAFGRDE